MNCNKFKNKVADLFDTNIDNHTQGECTEHMSTCPKCKAYYDELAKTIQMLQPRADVIDSRTKPKWRFQKLWRSVAAAVIFIAGVVTGWNHFFSSPAQAEEMGSRFIDQSIGCVQNVGSFEMDVFARTTPNENFAYFNPENDFVKINVHLFRQNDSVFFRVSKGNNGRTVVFDGNHHYMWLPGVFYLKGGPNANFLEKFVNLFYPERLLAMQKSAIGFSSKEKVVRSDNDSTIILTVETTEKNHNLQQLLETGKMDNCKIETENTFSKNDGLLRSVKVWCIDKGTKTLMLHIDDIQYNLFLNKEEIIALPDILPNEWDEVSETQSMACDRLVQLQNESPQDAAERIINAIINDDYEQAKEALKNYKSAFPILRQKMKGCKASNYETRQHDGYVGTYVFYTLTQPNGKHEKKHIALRNDNPQHIWIADGGL